MELSLVECIDKNVRKTDFMSWFLIYKNIKQISSYTITFGALYFFINYTWKLYSVATKNQNVLENAEFKIGLKGTNLSIFLEIHLISPSLNLSNNVGLMSHLLSTVSLK